MIEVQLFAREVLFTAY